MDRSSINLSGYDSYVLVRLVCCRKGIGGLFHVIVVVVQEGHRRVVGIES